MTCVFIIAALKQEADLYLSQGLHREALDLYAGFLARISDIDPDLKRSLEAAMAQIRTRMNAETDDEHQMLDDAALSRIKQGWRGSASHKDLLVSASALRDLGRYQEGLDEYRKLLVGRRHLREAVEGVADCLVHLTRPFAFPQAIDRLLGGIYKNPKNILMFKLLLAGKLDVRRHPDHCQALYRHLTQAGMVPAGLQMHVEALGERLKSHDSGQAEGDAYGPVDGLDFFYGSWTRGD